jgi:hypothetical protein
VAWFFNHFVIQTEKYMRSKLCIAIVLLLISCPLWAQDAKQVPDKIIDKIVGVWKIQKITAGKDEVAKNPTSGQWIEFRSDGTYLNHSTSLDSGSYRINENSSIVYLESVVNDDPAKKTAKMVTEWTVAFADEGMIMQRRSTGKREHVDKMKYFYTKVGEAEKTANN